MRGVGFGAHPVVAMTHDTDNLTSTLALSSNVMQDINIFTFKTEITPILTNTVTQVSGGRNSDTE